MKKNLLLSVLAVLLTIFSSRADSIDIRRPILSTYSIELGGGSVTDTYLSPLSYHGTRLALSGDWTKALPYGRNLSMSMNADIEGMRLQNPAGNANEWQCAAGFDWVIRKGWKVTEEFTVATGGGPGVYAGVIYLPRNSNNPAAAKAQFSLKGTLSGSYKMQWGQLPVTIRETVHIPVVGFIFCQNYGQPYYNIYLGNRSQLIHPAWWGNNFCLDNLLNLTMHFARGDLGIGYRFRYYSTHVCHLDTRIVTHSGVISWTPKRPNCSGAKIVEPAF